MRNSGPAAPAFPRNFPEIAIAAPPRRYSGPAEHDVMGILLFCSTFLLYSELAVLFVRLFLVWFGLILRLTASFVIFLKVFQEL